MSGESSRARCRAGAVGEGEVLLVRGWSEEGSRCGPHSRGSLWKLMLPGTELGQRLAAGLGSMASSTAKI